MTRKMTAITVPPSGTRWDFPANSRHARCDVCRQPRTPLWQTTPETHSYVDESGEPVPARVCARCWSKNHNDAPPDDPCPHCGKAPEDPLW